MTSLPRGWMNDSGLKWLADHAAVSQVFVEVGCFAGRSTTVLAQTCPGVVYAVDAWDETLPGLHRVPPGGNVRVVGPGDGDRIYQEFCRNLAGPIATGKVIPVRERSIV